MNQTDGYYRYPTISGDQIVFVCEGDLWSASTGGGAATRLTTTAAGCEFPRFSPDGKQLAFVGHEDGPAEIYLISAPGQAPERITHLGARRLLVSGWTPDGKNILFATDAKSPFRGALLGYKVSAKGGTPQALNLGNLVSLSQAEGGKTVIGTNEEEPAWWKRYHGGLSGEIWVDSRADGAFKRILAKLNGNTVLPMWVGSRIYFLSDHEGIGNLYSCRANGADVRKHTEHEEYYARFASTDGTRIVYTAGADIWLFDPAAGTSEKLDVSVPKMTRQAERRFVSASEWVESVVPNPAADALAIIARGQPITKRNWSGSPTQHGAGNSVRYRLIDWFSDGQRFVVVTDGEGYEQLEIHYADQSKEPFAITSQDFGRFVELTACDCFVAMTNHKSELFVIDIETCEVIKVDSSQSGPIRDLSWSPDGSWLAYTWPSTISGGSRIKVANVETKVVQAVTREVLSDSSPAWDPDGNYLYFVSTRTFKPVRDTVKDDLPFIASEKLYALPLRADVASPFLEDSRPLVKLSRDEKVGALEEVPEVTIDFDGIEDRIIPFPDAIIGVGSFAALLAVKGRVLFVTYDHLNASLEAEDSWGGDDSSRHCSLFVYDFEQQRAVYIASHISEVKLAKGGQFVSFLWGDDGTVRLVDVLGEIEETTHELECPSLEYSRRSGLINLDEIEVSVNPADEWRQMYLEAWRLQGQHFWDAGMSQIDWGLVRDRYLRLLPRIRTRGELSDLLWEMQGELGTSHAYEYLGEYPSSPQYTQGFLGGEFAWNAAREGWQVVEVIRGDIGNPEADSPLATPGANISEGDVIVAVDGQAVSRQETIERLLVNKGGKSVGLAIKDAKGKKRLVTLKTLTSEAALRYRAWVEANRAYVHEVTEGTVGYVHVPDMQEEGFAEFFRGYQIEHLRGGLVVDFRHNRGGNVSGLILQVLNRKVIGYDVPRWLTPSSYPGSAVGGPIVGLTNQFAASDGDIVSHSFKLQGIGPLVGKRTWGGVIGINPTHALVDGTVTTVPEYATWFKDVGWNVENYGTDPDIEVNITPEDARADQDPQLDRAIVEVVSEMARHPVVKPDFSARPAKPIPFHPLSCATTSGARRRRSAKQGK